MSMIGPVGSSGVLAEPEVSGVPAGFPGGDGASFYATLAFLEDTAADLSNIATLNNRRALDLRLFVSEGEAARLSELFGQIGAELGAVSAEIAAGNVAGAQARIHTVGQIALQEVQAIIGGIEQRAAQMTAQIKAAPDRTDWEGAPPPVVGLSAQQWLTAALPPQQLMDILNGATDGADFLRQINKLVNPHFTAESRTRGDGDDVTAYSGITDSFIADLFIATGARERPGDPVIFGGMNLMDKDLAAQVVGDHLFGAGSGWNTRGTPRSSMRANRASLGRCRISTTWCW